MESLSGKCPSCERFIGPADACPYCGTDSAKSPLLRGLRWAALLLAVLGVLFLYLMSVRRELPRVRIGDLAPAMNFARVRVAGTVERDPYVARVGGRADYLSFMLTDGSGSLRVAAYRDKAREIVDGGRVPARGSAVEVSGYVQVRSDGSYRLTIEEAHHLRTAEGDRP
jgi:hypothetical protein